MLIPLPILTTTPIETYTLSLHDALPIWDLSGFSAGRQRVRCCTVEHFGGFHQRFGQRGVRMDRIRDISSGGSHLDRKSTRLNSSHLVISYAVFCLKKKK